MKLILCLIGLCGTLSLQAPTFEGLPTGKERVASSNESMEQEVLRLINVIRKKRGLPTLKEHPRLTNAARYHAKDMQEDRYFEHDSHDRTASGRTKRIGSFTQRLKRFAPAIGGAWAENIAVGQRSADHVVETWMKSPGHRKNILNKYYRYLGVGYVGRYWVQDFAARVDAD